LTHQIQSCEKLFKSTMRCFALAATTELQLGSAEDGAALLGDTEDPFLLELGEVELSARCGGSNLEEYLEFCSQQALDWPEGVLDNHHNALQAIASQVSSLQTFLQYMPPVVTLFLTTGCEEARSERGVAYCRGKASIFIGRANLADWQSDAEALPRLLLHELWHIFSRNVTAEQRNEMYAVFGFRPINSDLGAPYPEEIRSVRWTNPDAMQLSHYVAAEVGEGETLCFVPMLFLEPYDLTDAEDSPLEHLVCAWGVLDPESLVWATDEVVEEGQQPRETTLLVPGPALPEHLYRQTSRNTVYMFHADEIAAENFVLAAMGAEQCDNPALVARFRALLE
jgi:hypothetical protein